MLFRIEKLTNSVSEKKMKTNDPPGSGMVGFAIIGLNTVGIASSVGALMAVFNDNNFVGAGVLAIAAALSYGLLLNSLVRT
jgi:hypothetical protein